MTVLGLDLGTTRIKAGALRPDGGLEWLIAKDAPTPHDAGTGDDAIRQLDPEALAKVADAVLAAARAKAAAPQISLGIASQRSTFLIWDPATGETLTPLISWQDRRAASWCESHRDWEPTVAQTTGLPLSPHYAGPKLASLLASDQKLVAALAGGALFGTLETWLLWRWSRGRVHATDLTMAARTLLADPRTGEWWPEALEQFGVPATALPRIVPTRGMRFALDDGLDWTAGVADQASGALTVFGNQCEAVLVNLGTGGFVLAPTGQEMLALPGYLSGPMFGGKEGQALFAAEGTINGAGPALSLYGPGPTDLRGHDSAPEAFCMPDLHGIGAPHWRPDLTQSFSETAAGQTTRGKRRTVLEGLAFRVREILEGLVGGPPFPRVLVSGGVAREAHVATALAAVLQQPVEVLDQEEATLLGAARLASGKAPQQPFETHLIEPGRNGAYLPQKYPQWRAWVATQLAAG